MSVASFPVPTYTSQPAVLVVAPNTEDLDVTGQRPQHVKITDMLGRMPNIGILYLAASLEKAGYPTATLDFEHEEMNVLSIVGKILSLNPRIIGFTMYDSTIVSTARCVALLRAAYAGPIVLGGYTATTHAADLLEYMPGVDYVMMREGESALVALLRCLEGDGRVDQVPNLVHRRDGELVFNPEGPLMDVREIPWPKRTWDNRTFLTPILARRGCFSKCTFCSMVRFYDVENSPTVRWRDASDVVDEIEFCIDHGATNFIFYDDDFGLSIRKERAWASAFIKEIDRRQLSFSWEVELRVPDIIRGGELLRDASQLGLSHLSIGMETMLPRQLKLYNKGYVQKDIFKAIDIARTLPLEFQTNVIFWDPWSTMDEAREHFRLLDSINFSDQLASVNFPALTTTLMPRRGTAFYDRLKAEGRLKTQKDSFWRFNYDFVDAEVIAFRDGVLNRFSQKRRAGVRPQALWLAVPRLERLGEKALAQRLRRYAKEVSRTEMDYFGALLQAWDPTRNPADLKRALNEVHNSLGERLSQLSGSMPADSCAILYEEVGRA